MSCRIVVGSIDEIAPGKHKLVRVGNVDVAVFNVDSNFYAIKDSCPHQGDSLSHGSLDGTVLTCPGHSWKFDIKSGRCVKSDDEISLRTFDTTVEDGKVVLSNRD